MKNRVAAFKIVFEIPTFSVAGEPFALYFGVQHDVEKSTTTELPPVYLRSVKIRYLEHVRLGLRQPVYTTDTVQTIKSMNQPIILQHDFGKDSQVRITEHMDLRDCILPEPLMVDGVAFETLNIKRNIVKASVALVLTCAGNEYPVYSRFGEKNGTYSIIAPAAPPKGIELAGSNGLPPEAQGNAIYESETKVAAGEIASEPIYEAGTRIVPGEMAGKSVHVINAKTTPSGLPDESVHELDNAFRSVRLGKNPIYELASSHQR